MGLVDGWLGAGAEGQLVPPGLLELMDGGESDGDGDGMSEDVDMLQEFPDMLDVSEGRRQRCARTLWDGGCVCLATRRVLRSAPISSCLRPAHD